LEWLVIREVVLLLHIHGGIQDRATTVNGWLRRVMCFSVWSRLPPGRVNQSSKDTGSKCNADRTGLHSSTTSRCWWRRPVATASEWTSKIRETLRRLMAEEMCETVVQKSSVLALSYYCHSYRATDGRQPWQATRLRSVHDGWRLPWAFGIVATDHCRATEAWTFTAGTRRVMAAAKAVPAQKVKLHAAVSPLYYQRNRNRNNGQRHKESDKVEFKCRSRDESPEALRLWRAQFPKIDE